VELKENWRAGGKIGKESSVSVCPTSASLTQADPATCPFLTRLFPIITPLLSFLPQPSILPTPSSFPSLPLMPTCRRKRVVLTEPSDALLQAVAHHPTREVYYLEQTGEIFESYEYVAFSFYPSAL
jgi:hypothetical protein